MSKRHKLLIKVISAGVSLCAVVAVSLSLIVPGAAAVSESDLQKKVLYNALGTCVNSYMQSPIDGTKTFSITNVVKDSPKSIVMPTYASNGADLKIDCKQLFVGTTTIRKKPSKYTVTGLLNNLTPTATDLGYIESGTSTGKKCISVKYDSQAAGSAHLETLTTNAVCFPVDGNTIKVQNASEVTVEGSCPDEAGKMCLGYDTIGITWIAPGSIAYSGYLAYPNNGTTIDELKDYINKNVIEPGTSPMIPSGAIVTITGYDITDSSSLVSTAYRLDSSSALNALRYVAGPNEDYKTVALTDNDYYQLYKGYMNYVTDAYRGQVSINKSNCSADKNVATYAWTEDGTNWCEVTGVDSVTESFGGRGSGGWARGLTVMDFRGILSSAKSLNLGKVDSGSFGTISGQPGPGGDTPGENPDEPKESGLAVCYEGTGVLGWFACPAIELVGNATGYLYEHWIEPSLQIQAGQFMKRDGAVYGAWDTFRGFANTLFAVAFAVIILAQLTGIGISNYNIKKMLPRLIMVAVLVNISFVLCQVAVDLSNILGVALKDLFLGLAGEAGKNLGAEGFFVTTVKALTEGLLAVGGTVAILGGGVAVATLKYWIFPILVSLLSCAVAILFFFILLGVRQAGVIILVVLTPLAIVCYALPNTKSFFDRWRKMFTSLLVLYPICGAMMGACEYAATILTQIDQDAEMKMGFTLVAMLVDVVPFFFIPSLVRSSMVAMGNLGAKISNFGNGLGRWATGVAQGSRAFRDHQAEAQRQLNYERDTRTTNKLNRRAEGKGLIGRGRKFLSRAPIAGRFVREGLTSGEVLRASRAASGISQSTDTTAQAMLTRMNSDGSINNIGDLSTEGTDKEAPDFQGSLVARYRAASRRLFKDPTDRDALEEKKAVSMALAKSKPGLEQLRLANSQLISEVAAMPEGDKKQVEDKRRAKQVLQQTVNDLRRTNGGDIAKSTMLDEQMTLMGNIGANYDTIDSEALASSIGKLSPKNVSNVPKQDLRAYQQAMASGKLDAKAYNKLSDAMIGALSDPRYSGSIEADAMPLVQTLADNKYTRKPAPHATQAEIESAQNENITAMSRANDVELGRIHDRIRSRSMSAGAQADLMNTMGQTLVRSLEPDSGVKLSANQASQMTKILQEGGYDLNSLAQQHGMTDASQLQERLDISTGMKVPRAPRMSGLRDHPQQWRQATAADVAAVHGQLDGSRLRVGDWVKNEELSGPPTADGRAPTRMVRMSPTEVRAAEMLQGREAESLLQQSDESFASRQAWQNQQNQYRQQGNQGNQQQGDQQHNQSSQGSQQQGDQQRRQRSNGGRQSSDQDNRRDSDGRQGQRDGDHS